MGGVALSAPNVPIGVDRIVAVPGSIVTTTVLVLESEGAAD